MVIQKGNRKIHLVIVYSAYHTGTWFTIELLGTSKEGEISRLGRSDNWGREYAGTRIEELETTAIDEAWFNRLAAKVPEDFYDMDLLILQTHHKGVITPMYKVVLKQKTEVPIVIPMRDPLLATNSKIWRSYSTYNIFKAASPAYREIEVKEHIEAIKNLLLIPRSNIFINPIDNIKLHTENERAKRVTKLLKFCQLTPTKESIKQAIHWTAANKTTYYLETQKIQKDSFFQDMKQAIKNKDIHTIKKYYDLEFRYLQKQETLKKYLRELGYPDLIWY